MNMKTSTENKIGASASGEVTRFINESDFSRNHLSGEIEFLHLQLRSSDGAMLTNKIFDHLKSKFWCDDSARSFLFAFTLGSSTQMQSEKIRIGSDLWTQVINICR